MSMTDFWKDFGLGLMNLFDLPGSMARDAFAWENPLDQLADPFGHENRATGADVLRNFGVEDPGMVAGMGVEMLLDPMNLIGGLGALKGAKMSAKLGPRYRTMFRRPVVPQPLVDLPENWMGLTVGERFAGKARALPPSDPLERAILREVPPGSKPIKEGSEAVIFETPSETVVRVERTPLGGGNLHNVDAPMSEFIEHGRIPDVPEIIPVRRNAVIRADHTQAPVSHPRPLATGSWLETPVAGENIIAGPGSKMHERVRITHSPKAEPIPASGLEYGQGVGRRIPRDHIGEHWHHVQRKVDPISDAEKAAAVRARMDPGYEAVLSNDDMLKAHFVDKSTGGPSKGGMLRKLGREMETQEEFLRAQGRVSDDEFRNLIRSLDDRGLDPWDVHNASLSSETQNLMLHEGRATIPDIGAVRERGPVGLFEERGGSFIEPEIIDITRGRPIRDKVSSMLEDMFWDPLTAVTGHRARTRAAVAGLEPGMYGKVMPYAVPSAAAVQTGLLRPLFSGYRDEQDVPGTL
jgi:hypothetical protein